MTGRVRGRAEVRLGPRLLGVVGAIRRAALAHPLVAVAAIAGIGALLSAVFIWRYRTLGNLDPDEAGYLATALTYHRALAEGGPAAVVEQVRLTTLAPLVPLLSLPFLVVGPRDVRAAMMVQPLLLVLASVATAGIARRWVGPGMTVLVGATVAASTSVIAASQAYWYGLAAGAILASAVWVLLASEGLSDRRWLLFGALVGLLPLARTMAIAFVPGLLLGAALIAGRTARGRRGLAGALVVSGLVAGPWLYAQSDEIGTYLLGYGYGPRAAEFGSGPVHVRLWVRLVQAQGGWGIPLVVVPIGAALAVRRRLRRRGGAVEALRPPWSSTARELVVVHAMVVLGLGALVSTTNRGIWFELPIVLLAVALWGFAMVQLPRGWQRVLVVQAVAFALIVPFAGRAVQPIHSGDPLSQSDPRFGGGREEVAIASDEWEAVQRAVVDELGLLTENGQRGTVVVIGNTALFSSNVVLLYAELLLWRPDVRIIDSDLGPEDRAPQLTPMGEEPALDGVERERVLVVARHDLKPFPTDEHWREVERQALAVGWIEVETFELPVEGEVAILRHRDNLS